MGRVHLIVFAPDEGLLRSHLLTVAADRTQIMLIRLDNDYIGSGPEKKIKGEVTEKENFVHLYFITGRDQSLASYPFGFSGLVTSVCFVFGS